MVSTTWSSAQPADRWGATRERGQKARPMPEAPAVRYHFLQTCPAPACSELKVRRNPAPNR